jgi:hypothetical protein
MECPTLFLILGEDYIEDEVIQEVVYAQTDNDCERFESDGDGDIGEDLEGGRVHLVFSFVSDCGVDVHADLAQFAQGGGAVGAGWDIHDDIGSHLF